MSAIINTPGTLKKATKIDDATWELHRSTITQLYVEKKLEGEDGLIDTMTKNYRFTASKSQYEGRFREWNLRKNLKRKDWQGIIEHVHKRTRIGKESEVRLNGAVLTNKRVAREALRYGWTRDCQIEVSEGICATPHVLAVYISSPDTNSHLPEDVTVCTPPSLGAEDERLQIVHQVSRDAIPNQGHCHVRQDHSIQMTGVGTGLLRVTTCGFKPLREEFQPFAWLDALDWKSVPDSMIRSLRSVRNYNPTSTQIAAMFFSVRKSCSAPRDQNDQPGFDGSTTAIEYSMASILNKSRSSDFNPYYWLRGIPWPIAARIFGTLPGPIRDTFREMMFAEALRNDDETLTKAMLELGIDPLEKINIGGRDVAPSVYTAKHIKFSALRVLILYMIKTDAKKELESLLPIIITTWKVQPFDWPLPPVSRKAIELIRLILSSGANISLRAFQIAADHHPLWKELMRAQKNGIYGWLQTGFFLDCIKSLLRDLYFEFFDWVTGDLLRTNAEMDALVNEKVRAALSDLFAFLVHAGLIDIAQALFETCVTIKIRLLYPTNEHTSVNDTVAQACQSMDLNLLQEWADDSSSYHLQCSSPSTISGKLEQAVFPNRRHPEATSESIYEAVLNDDLLYVESELNRSSNQKTVDERWELGFRQAAKLGRDKIAIAMLQHPNLPANLIRDGFSVLLLHGRIFPLSECVCTYPQVRQALVSATTESNYDRLDDMLRQRLSFSKPLKPPNSSGHFHSLSQINKSPGVLLGTLACYSIHHDDSKLLEWLFEFGVEVHWHFTTAHVQIHGYPGLCCSPPLLGIAAANGKTQVVRYLLEREGRDNLPLALSWVIQSQASEESTSILLNEFKSPETHKVARGYSQPLRHAIRNRDYNLVRLLARSADINYIVQETETHRDIRINSLSDHSSPLGEAVITLDLEATKIMLENGGDPNMLALILRGIQNQSKNCSPDGAFLERSTSIIAAIDTKSLPMVQLLVQRHLNAHESPRSGLLADINHPPRLGLIRTPLQRAAEIGCFDIVRYLVEQGADIDLAPCFGGGTALQLAAIQGHVGIATFLLERGADPNFPPARGPGRTAFEAAAEWNRIDMMSLLMKWGCRLEMVIANDPDERSYNHLDTPYFNHPIKRYDKDSDDEVETDQHLPPTSTQYERAMRFAKEFGHMACKRFIEHLYQQCVESTPEGYWDPESFTNAEQDLDWDSDFWKQFGLEI